MLPFLRKQRTATPDTAQLRAECEDLRTRCDDLENKLKNLTKESLSCIQKVGIVRFNPFQEMGGDQSFALALLNGENNGIVITSLYLKDGNRVYGKPVAGGSSTYQLNNEEIQALEDACGTVKKQSRNIKHGKKQ